MAINYRDNYGKCSSMEQTMAHLLRRVCLKIHLLPAVITDIMQFVVFFLKRALSRFKL